MKIGIPKEIKAYEYRVGLTPDSVCILVQQGHEVWLEQKAGIGVGFSDKDYQNAGAQIAETAEIVFETAQLIVKVKEPQPKECAQLKPHHIVFTYLHLAPDPVQAEGLLNSGCAAMAYETVTDAQNRLPLLAPMSEVAGRLSIQVGAHCLEKRQGGRGILLSGVPGVPAAKVVVVGGGVVGLNAVRMAVGQSADVTVLDKSLDRLRALDLKFGGRIKTLYAAPHTIEQTLAQADLVIGAVLVTGHKAPKLITRDLLKKMQAGAVIVDVCIDQGGCCETSRITTHDQPTYEEEQVIHYGVANMPGVVPLTSTLALNNISLPFVRDLANKGLKRALEEDEHLLNGLNVYQGRITHQAVAQDLDYPYCSPRQAIQK